MKLKTILYWNPFNGRSDYFFGLGRQPVINANCPVNTCTFTDDIAQFNQSDVVLFNIQLLEDVPPYRFEHQRFVFYQMESPENAWPVMDRSPTRYNFFNWTMTYRLDSDIVQHDWYGAVVSKRSHRRRYPEKNRAGRSSTVHLKRQKTRRDFWRSKTKMVVWINSHCPTPIRREEYVRQLSQYIQVDSYGKCGNLSTCGDDANCIRMMRNQYKFHLSIENSWCPDYITEKFYRPLLYGVVPIVLGSVDYDQFAPPHSYINAFDFPSAKELAEYLHLLDRNEDLYARYFDWKRNYEVIASPKNAWCELCQMANDPKQPVKVYSDVKRWWDEQVPCLSESFEYF